MLIIRRKSTF